MIITVTTFNTKPCTDTYEWDSFQDTMSFIDTLFRTGKTFELEVKNGNHVFMKATRIGGYANSEQRVSYHPKPGPTNESK